MTIVSFENERQQFLDKISESEKSSNEKEVLYKSLDKRYQTEKLKVKELEIKFEKTKAILKLIPGVLEDFVKTTTIYRTNNIICKKFSHLDNTMSHLQKNVSLLNKKYDLIKERNNAVLNAEQNMGIVMKNENLNKNNMSGVFDTTIIDNSDFINDKSDKSGDRSLSPIRIDWYIGGSCENCDNMYKYVSDIKELADASLANKRTIMTLEEELKVLREKCALLEEKETENKVLLDEALQMLGEKIETIEELKQDFIDLEEQYKQTVILLKFVFYLLI